MSRAATIEAASPMSDHTETRIIIRHTSIDALKASPLWREIMNVSFADGDVSVIEISDAALPREHDGDT
jgi:hypothetical protein